VFFPEPALSQWQTRRQAIGRRSPQEFLLRRRARGDYSVREISMPTGKVKWFDQKKGYGFIVPDDGGRDLFVHITAVQKAGYSDLVQGVRVSYEIRPDREGNPTAESLRFW
jgi:CspA family cold shock protein